MDQSLNEQQKYQDLVKRVSPDSHLVTDCIKAFITGGIICLIGQFITNFFTNLGYSIDQVSMIAPIVIIFLTAILTGLGAFSHIGKFGGAGSFVPITGFANAIVSPAIEFKKEGYVFGVGAKMFLIAGPVIVYGVFTSVVVGLIYFLITY